MGLTATPTTVKPMTMTMTRRRLGALLKRRVATLREGVIDVGITDNNEGCSGEGSTDSCSAQQGCCDEEADSWPGCRRRRHSGECSFRRRRDKLPDETGKCWSQASTDNVSAYSAEETCQRRRRHGTCEYRRRRGGCDAAPAGTLCEDVHSMGCRRRRRHGTCEFRRRRQGGDGLINTEAADAPGCRRRRRHGECNFRRRRNSCTGPSGTTPDASSCLNVDSSCPSGR